MVGAIDPRLQVREDKMDHRQMLLRLLWITPERERIVPIAHSDKVVIPLPAVSADGGAWRHIVPDESGKRIDVATRKRSLHLFDAGDDAEPKTPGVSKFLDRDAFFVGIPPLRAASFSVLSRPHLDSANNRRLMMGSFTFPARTPTYIAFVYFDGMRRPDGVAIGPYHTGAEFVKHRERRFIGSDAKLALELDGRLAGRLCRHEIGAPKPSRERHVARLHDRPGGERRIFLTGTAAQHNRRTGCKPIGLAHEPTLLASKAVRPADCFQVMGASAVVRENALEFGKARWEGCIHVQDDSTSQGYCHASR